MKRLQPFEEYQARARRLLNSMGATYTEDNVTAHALASQADDQRKIDAEKEKEARRARKSKLSARRSLFRELGKIDHINETYQKLMRQARGESSIPTTPPHPEK